MSNRKSIPENPLVDGVPSETLDRVRDLLTWLEWHPLMKGDPAPHIAEQLRMADLTIGQMLKDAVEHVGAQVETAG